jgi:prenyltransferase beta subunit
MPDVTAKLLGEAVDLVADFLRGRQNDDGGFKDRAGASDLYYTVFGMEGLIALRADVPHPKIASYLRPFGDGASLDFVHLGCLARCWANLPKPLQEEMPREGIAARIEGHRSTDGGYSPTAPEEMTNDEIRIHESMTNDEFTNDETASSLHSSFVNSSLIRHSDFVIRHSEEPPHPNPLPRSTGGEGTKTGTVYGCFLAAASYQDLGLQMPDPLAMLNCLQQLRAADGGYSNQEDVPIGMTPATAAAVTLLRHLQQPIDPALGRWLLAQCRPEGGFLAMPDAPIPDLLSTATALHALSGMQFDFEPVKEPCLDFLDTLWTNKGSFHGNWTDDLLDTEYTYYGLLALGHLSL